MKLKPSKKQLKTNVEVLKESCKRLTEKNDLLVKKNRELVEGSIQINGIVDMILAAVALTFGHEEDGETVITIPVALMSDRYQVITETYNNPLDDKKYYRIKVKEKDDEQTAETECPEERQE